MLPAGEVQRFESGVDGVFDRLHDASGVGCVWRGKELDGVKCRVQAKCRGRISQK
jgi:hypothetical protein